MKTKYTTLLALGALCLQSNAADGTWTADADGNWTDIANWNSGAGPIADGADFTATFGNTITADRIVTLNADRTIGNITASATSRNYTISGANILTLDVTTGKPIIDVITGRTLTISSVIAGNDGLTKTGNGILLLRDDNNSFTGNITISAGTLKLGDNNDAGSLGGGSYAGDISIATGATFFDQSNSSQTLSGVISGGGTLIKSGGGTLTLSGNNTYTGQTIIGSGGGGGRSLSVSSFNSVNGGTPLMASSSLGAPTTVADGTIQLGFNGNVRTCTLTYTGSGETTDRVMNVQFNSNAKHTISNTGGGLLNFTSDFTITPSTGNTGGGLTLRGSGDGQIAQMGTIPGILEKADAGTWTIGGANAANSVSVAGGTLIINGSLDTVPTTVGQNTTPAGEISVASGATLGGAATVGSAITVAAGAKLAPGASVNTVGTLTVDGTLNISAMAGGAGVINMDLDSIAASDEIAAGTLNIGTDVLNFADFNFTALAGLENGTYTLISSGAAVTGTLDPTPANLTGAVGDGTGTLKISDSGTNIELVISGITGGGSSYDTWATINAPTGTPADDFDGDGVSNAIEFVLGGDKDTNDLDKLPAVATTGTDMIFTFIRDRDSIDASVNVEIEVSTDLEDWTETYPVGAVSTADVTVTDNLDGTDTITLTVARAPNDKKFARLKVTITP